MQRPLLLTYCMGSNPLAAPPIPHPMFSLLMDIVERASHFTHTQHTTIWRSESYGDVYFLEKSVLKVDGIGDLCFSQSYCHPLHLDFSYFRISPIPTCFVLCNLLYVPNFMFPITIKHIIIDHDQDQDTHSRTQMHACKTRQDHT